MTIARVIVVRIKSLMLKYRLPPAIVLIMASVFVEQGMGEPMHSYYSTLGIDQITVYMSAFLPIVTNKFTPAYIAGLVEGDGSLVTPGPRADGGKKRYPKVTICFALKDLPLANLFVTVFGGSVYTTPGKWLVFTLQNPRDIYAFVVFINGYMRTPKIDALHNMINWLNASGNYPILPLLGLDNTSLYSNGWLAGILEADCSFQLTFRVSLITGLIIDLRVSMILTQRLMYHVVDAALGASFLPIMSIIADQFLCNVMQRVRERVNCIESNCGVNIKSLESRLALINYLSMYPLMSSKRLDYLDWVKAHKMLLSKEYKTISGAQKLVLLKSGMNDGRTYFDWSNLD
ncbi:MAG: LAGLIDADG family homing endonuclease [Sulfolobus sp.]|nr:LAGLIDADG family homing endonuclease [Sulfolobus sp.]